MVTHTYSLVAAMVVGFDIHPIAAEMARATLASALAAYRPGRKPVNAPLQVFVANSLHDAEEAQQSIAGTLPLRSAGGKIIDIPNSLLTSPDADAQIAELVERAIGIPKEGFPAKTGAADFEQVTRQMADVIVEEGNHVWKWYLRNQIAPAALSRRKVGAILTNPPWLVANDTPDGERKAAIGRLRARYGLAGSPRWTAKGDLAAVFSARVVDLYLRADGGAFGFVLPGSALNNQTWAGWRTGAWGSTCAEFVEARGMDEISPAPFPHSSNGACIVSGRRSPDTVRPLDDEIVLICSGDPNTGKVIGRKRRRSRASAYEGRFRRGCLGSPLGLLLVVGSEQDIFDDSSMVGITTKPSTKGQWAGVSLTGVIEALALRPVLRAQRLEPFLGTADAWYIAPGAALGRHPNSALGADDEDFREMMPAAAQLWEAAETVYEQRRGATSRPTLWENLDYNGSLTRQLSAGGGRTKVFYNKSGGVGANSRLRACRGPASLLADDKCYWCVAENADEALYLIGILNADCLQDAWRESKTSRNHFDKNPLRHVPIPRFDPVDERHSKITACARRAESEAESGQITKNARNALDAAVLEILDEYAD